jgi:hypothetical protein
VVCSTTQFKKLVGSETCQQLLAILDRRASDDSESVARLLNSALLSYLQQNFAMGAKPRAKRMIPTSQSDAMQVEYTRRGETTVASSSSSSSFDWHNFLKVQCDLSEEECHNCEKYLTKFSIDDAFALDSSALLKFEIHDPSVRVRILTGIGSYFLRKESSDH